MGLVEGLTHHKYQEPNVLDLGEPLAPERVHYCGKSSHEDDYSNKDFVEGVVPETGARTLGAV